MFVVEMLVVVVVFAVTFFSPLSAWLSLAQTQRPKNPTPKKRLLQSLQAR